VHKGNDTKEITLTDIVLNYLANKGEFDLKKNQGFIPGLAHRIDRNTSGIVIFGKNVKALQELEKLFKERKLINKFYLALVNGKIRESGVIDKPLYKDEKLGMVSIRSISQGGKTAITKYGVEEIFDKYTLVNVELLTGRTHQIRVHFSSINHPLLGDSKYGDFLENKEFKKLYKYENQFLHAYKVRFAELEGVLSNLSNKEFVAKLGNKEIDILEKLRNERRN
jgi:23S rRNA pseudouridine955/2504/2580 synthase